jgi:hypothetical protein
MITISNFSIINNGTELAVDVETGIGFEITSIRFWDMNSFKDYTLSIDGSFKLENTNNQEVLIYTAAELEVASFKDLWFMEVETNQPEDECSTCFEPALAITYNLYDYYKCSLNEFLKANTKDCTSCKPNINKGLITSINLGLEAIILNIELGFYSDAIDQVNMLKKLCSLTDSCVNCGTVECTTCGTFKQFTP